MTDLSKQELIILAAGSAITGVLWFLKWLVRWISSARERADAHHIARAQTNAADAVTIKQLFELVAELQDVQVKQAEEIAALKRRLTATEALRLDEERQHKQQIAQYESDHKQLTKLLSDLHLENQNLRNQIRGLSVEIKNLDHPS